MTNLRSRLKNLAKRRLADLQNYGQEFFSGPAGKEPPHTRCLRWLRRNELPSGGIRVHSRHSEAYPEVTGYLVPTLLNCGETDLARRCLRWLLRVQRADGGFTSPEGEAYIFDSGQALRGLLAGLTFERASRQAAGLCADYLCREMVEHGRMGFAPRYDRVVPESIHLYVLPPLIHAAELLGKPEYREAAQRCLEFYLRHADALKLTTLTHFLAYELEALIDLERADAAIPILRELKEKQGNDGSVRAFNGSRWVCTPGLAQLAVCWYKLGEAKPADRALAWLERHERVTGGFFGSYGPGATYFPREELSWAAKFYLDARNLKVTDDRNDTFALPEYPPLR